MDSDYDYDVSELYDSDNEESYTGLLGFLKNQDQEFEDTFLSGLCDYLTEELIDWDNCHGLVENELESHSWHTESDIVGYFQEQGLEIYLCFGKVIWEDVTMFFDRDHAQEFVDTFGYRHGKLRVYVKSGWESDQYREIIAAMIEGKLVWEGE